MRKTANNPAVVASRQAGEAEERQRRRRLRLSEKMEPADWQEHHHPTTAVMVKVAETRMKQQGRRRKMDARLWEAMTPEQEAAAHCIGAAFRILSGELGCKTMAFGERTDKGHEAEVVAASYRAKLVDAYFTWGRECAVEHISHAAAMDVIAYGKGVRAVEQDRQKRNGWARDNLFGALDLYARIYPRLVGHQQAA